MLVYFPLLHSPQSIIHIEEQTNARPSLLRSLSNKPPLTIAIPDVVLLQEVMVIVSNPISKSKMAGGLLLDDWAWPRMG